MRAWFLACTACGRVGFDPLAGPPAGDGPAGDASADADPGSQIHYVASSTMGTSTMIATLDVATGALTSRVGLPLVAGEVNSLIAIDATTLLASSFDGMITTINLEPPSSNTLADPVFAQVVGIDNDAGNIAYALEQSTNSLCRVTLPDFTRVCQAFTTFEVEGGDIARAPDGIWYAWSNSQMQLFTIDIDTAVGTPVEPGDVGPEELTGLVFGPDGVLRALSRSSNELIEIDRNTGMYTKRTSLCLDVICPTVFDLQFGDLARGR